MKPMDQIIEKFLKKIRNRLMFQKVISSLFIWMTVGVAAGLIVSVVTLVVPFYYGFVIALVCVIAGVLSGIVWGVVKSPDMEQSALIADSRGYKEKFYTAYTEKSENIFMKLLKAEAAELAGKYDIRKNLPFKLSVKRLGIFMVITIIFIISLVIDTPARKEAELKHQVKELAEEYADELMEEKTRIEQSDTISDEEKAELLDIIDKSLAEVDGIEDYNELRDVQNRTLMKMDIAAAYAGDEIKGIVADTAETIGNAQIAADKVMTEKGYEVNKTSQYAASNYGNGSNLGAGSENSDGNDSNNSSGSESSGNDSSSENGDENSSKGQNSAGNGNANGDVSTGNGNASDEYGSTGNGNASNGDGSTGNGNSSNGDGSTGNGNTSNGDGSTGDGNSSNGSGSTGNGNSTGTGNGSGWNTGNMTGQEVDSSFDESITIPDKTVGNDDNLTGNAFDTDSSYTVKGGQAQGFSGNKVSYGTVAGEYKNKAYSNLESSSYPDSMKDYIRRYFDGLN